jgi:eukaryotic-like serine/threonine-protein kinase
VSTGGPEHRDDWPTLARWLDEHGTPPWRTAIAVGSGIARALAQCEADDRFPGPLRPDAILVGPGDPPQVRLRAPAASDGDTRVDSARLSRWSAPEQADGAHWDHAANRYVLALLLYRMLAGQHPFAGKGLRRGLEEQASRGAPPFSAAVAEPLPPGLHGLVLRGLDPDPQQRPRHALAIADKLDELARGGGPSSAILVRSSASTAELAAPAPVSTAIAAAVGAPVAQPVTQPVAQVVAQVVTQVAAPRRRPRAARAQLAWLLAVFPLAGGVVLGAELGREARTPSAPAGAKVGERAPLGSTQTSADDCSDCHPDHAAQWHGSVMAHAVKSPLFQSLEILIQEQGGREFGCDAGAGILRPSDDRTACRDRTTGLAVTGSGGALWCVNCHAPGENLANAVPPWNGLAASSASRQPLRDILPKSTMDGISCAFCHQVHGPVRPGEAARGGYEGNPDWISVLTGERFSARPEDARGVFGIGNSGYALDARELLLGAGAATPVPTGAHGRPTATAREYLESSEFCGACHDVRLFGTDAIGIDKGEHFKRLRNAYSEWRSWADDERRGGREPASCQDCHMSAYPGVCEPVGDGSSALGQLAAGATALARACPPGTAFAARSPGQYPTGMVATSSGSATEIAPHWFTGVDVPLSDEFPAQLVDDTTLDGAGIPRGARQRRDLLLGRTFRFELDEPARRGATLEIPVVIENVGAGHRVPAGFSQEREFWVHLQVTDADGRVLYEVGDVESASEDLRDKIFRFVNVDDSIVDNLGRPLGLFGAEVIDGPDVPLWEPPPITGATSVRGRGLINLQNGFLRCVTCIGQIDGQGRCQPGLGQGRHRADRFDDGKYDPDTGACESNLSGNERFFETYFPVGGLDATRGVVKAPDAIIDTRSAPPGVPLRFTYELPIGSARGPIAIEARLLFRAFPPFLIAAFADYEARMAARGLRPSGALVTRALLDRLEVVELHRLRLSVP